MDGRAMVRAMMRTEEILEGKEVRYGTGRRDGLRMGWMNY